MYRSISGTILLNLANLVLSMLLSGACAFFIYLVSSSLANLLISCAFGLVSTMGFNALDCLGIELFPTRLRYVDKILFCAYQYLIYVHGI